MKHLNLFVGYCILLIISFGFGACTRGDKKGGDEQLVVDPSSEQSDTTDTLLNSVTGNVTMQQLSTFPHEVILTGIKDHRLVSVYRSINSNTTTVLSKSYSSYDYGNDDYNDGDNEHFMPGIDVLFGYNLLNLAHYDMKAETVNYLFDRPVLIKTLYYPSFEQDSLFDQPVNRDYYLLSVYDEDTNKDTLINRHDLRRFYHFNAATTVKTQVIPPDYSAIHSQYDALNDAMYIFARHDENQNGKAEKSEPIHVFWISLVTPGVGKLMY